MRKFYDDFIQSKPKEMAKLIEDMTFKYLNPESQQPTRVPATHYEKELGQEIERTVSQAVSLRFLTIMYDQLNLFKKENEDLFYKALICMDNNLNPKDLRISEQIALNHSYEVLQNKQIEEKRKFHFFNQDIVDEYKKGLTDPNLQARAMELSNFIEREEERELNNVQNPKNNQSPSCEDEYEEEQDDMDYDY